MKETFNAIPGILISGGNRGQRVLVPDYTLEQIEDSGGLAYMAGDIIELVPVVKGEEIIPIFDILVRTELVIKDDINN